MLSGFAFLDSSNYYPDVDKDFRFVVMKARIVDLENLSNEMEFWGLQMSSSN